MRFRLLTGAVLVASTVVTGVEHRGVFGASAEAQTSGSRSGGIPRFEADPSWPQLPAKWKLGDVSSVAVDAQDRVWVLHRPRTLAADRGAMAAPPVLVFDGAGRFVRAWGGAASGYEWPQREHGIHIDYKGFVWLGGNYCPERKLERLKPVADDQLLKFTQDGKFVLQIGRSTQSRGNADTKNLQQPADAWVYPKTNELFVADGYGNHRIVVFDADTGQFKRMWGAFGNTPVDKDNCPPEHLETVPDGPGPQQFSLAHAIRISNDGLVYVADRENRRVQVFTIDGKFVKQVVRGSVVFARSLALSPDPDQQFLYVGGKAGIFVLDRKTLDVVEVVDGKGEIGRSHEITTDSKGNVYLALGTQGLQKLVFKGLGGQLKTGQ